MNDSTDTSTSVTVVVSGGIVTSVNGSPSSGPVDITLQKANFNVLGTVVESNGTTPAVNAGVSAGNPGVFCCNNTSTDQNGNYAFDLADGTWSITASPPNGDSADAQTSVTVVVSGGVVTSVNGSPSSGPVDITLQKTNLTGTVVESNGTTPAVNAGVSAGNPGVFCCNNTSTDQNGNYGFALADGTWTITASPPMNDSADASTSVNVVVSGGVVTSVNGSPSSGPVNITLQTANVTGTVTKSAAAGGGAAQNSGVSAQQQGAPNSAYTSTDTNGHYGLHLADGTWVVTASPPTGDTTDASTSVSVTVSGGVVTGCAGTACGGTLPAVNITLQLPGSISGTVTDFATSADLQGICVTAFPVGGGFIGTADTGTGGTYSISNLAPGNYDVEFGPSGLCPGGSAGNYPGQYYKGVSSQSSATPVTVTSGVATPDIDAGMGSPFPPAPPSGSVSSASGTSIDPSGSAVATNNGTTVEAGGQGAITVAQYGSDPVGTPGFSTPGGFLDVAVASGSNFSSLTVTDCNLNGATSLQWWTGSAWEAVSPTSGPTGNPACLTATLSSTSTPTVAELTGTVFAAAVTAVPTVTTIARTSGAPTVQYGSSLTFTAKVTVPSGSATPNGKVTFYDGTTAISGPVALTGDVASFTTTTLGAGTHSISAAYSGDLSTLASSSSSIRETVTKRATATNVTASPNPSTVGQAVTLTATVAPSLGHGTVTFYDGLKAISGPLSLSGGGVATFKTSGLNAGIHWITADYSGDANTNPSLGMTGEVVAKRSSATTLTSSANPSKAGSGLTLTATVAPANATGTVNFNDGTKGVGSCVLNNGTCSWSTTKLPKGTNAMTAVYVGDGQTFGSTSPVLKQVVG